MIAVLGAGLADGVSMRERFLCVVTYHCGGVPNAEARDETRRAVGTLLATDDVTVTDETFVAKAGLSMQAGKLALEIGQDGTSSQAWRPGLAMRS